MFKPINPKVNFVEMEKKWLKEWDQKGIVEKYLHRNDKSDKKFSFLDGPITANNPMGVHHAWGRTYKDVFQRFWNMRGYKQRFQNGFDEQGLWVEVEVEKELGLKSKKDIENLVPGNKFKSLEKFINLCKERVKKYFQIQTDQSKRLGYFMDWDHSYHTSSLENNYAIWNFLKVVNEKGWLYKGRDSVPWCPRCGTAISQHEILTEEYQELTHESIFFKLPIEGRENEHLLVWTTTPWTIPANVAVAVNIKENYIGIKINNEILWLMEKRYQELKKEKIIEGEIVSTKKGKELIGLEYIGPFDDFDRIKESLGEYKHRVVAGDERILPVSKEEGTGLVHTATGAGTEDFALGKKEKLPVIEIIDEEANYLDGMRGLSSVNAKKNPGVIIDYLRKKENGKYLFTTHKYTHRYPTCWRCKTELVWRVVDEWYIAMDKPESSKFKVQSSKSDGKTFREQMIGVAKKINWLPKWGLERELDWLSNMHDWLISKKRYWGLALPIWECQNCGKFTVIGSLDELKEKAVEGLEKVAGHSPHRPLIDEVKIKCLGCNKVVSRIPDVGNPWLDAGIVPFSTMPTDWFPADFITESFPGQFKNWFYSLIAMSTALKGTNSFKTVLGFASVMDEKGEEMHKSKGNMIEFNEAAEKIGVDVMRWLYVTQDPERNLNFGYHVADEIRRKFHLMLWNIYNFFVSNANFDNWKEEISESKNVLDKWIISKLNNLIKDVTECLEKYDSYTASLEVGNFVNDLSLWYVRRSRDRIGTSSEDLAEKNSCYSTLYAVLINLSKILSVFNPFVSEEIFTNIANNESVHLVNWPEYDQRLIDTKLEDKMAFVRKIVEMGHAKRKELGIKVRQPLKKFQISNFKFQIESELAKLVKDELNVKEVVFLQGKGDLSVDFDIKLTNELINEGKAREIIRRVQGERKKLGTKLNEKINVVLEDWPVEFEDYIIKKALVNSLSKGDFSVTKA